jgi:hypothetical protein
MPVYSGSLLVNEFFEQALRREEDHEDRDPKPYYLYIDEFQNFVSLDLTKMLDQVRKFGLFLIMAHQRFGHLDENLTDAVLTNCGIKAVFGGLPVESARVMAQEMFIGDLDPKKVKAAIYQTKFWPEYRRDKVYSNSTTHSSGSSRGESSGQGYGFNTTSGEFFQPNDWFGSSSTGTSQGESRSSFSFSGSGQSTSDSFGDSQGVADIPIFFPVPFKELSSVEHYTIDEQIWELTKALKEQFERHCFIKVRQQTTQPMLVPFVKSFYTTEKNLDWYKSKLLNAHNALRPDEVDVLIEEREQALLKAATAEPIDVEFSKGKHDTPKKQTERKRRKSARTSVFATIRDEPT